MRRLLPVLALAVLVVPTGAPHALGASAPADCLLPTVDDRCESWVGVYNNTHWGDFDIPRAMAVGPAGDRVYVTGDSIDVNSKTGLSGDIVTVAFAQSSGQKLWEAHYDGPISHEEYAHAIAVSPDGATVYVAGQRDFYSAVATGGDALLLAYDTATGAQRWVAAYDGVSEAPEDFDRALAVAVSARGDRVYVTGMANYKITAPAGGGDFLTAGYDAATGQLLWDATFDGPAGGIDVARGLAVDPTGERVYVTGWATAGPAGGGARALPEGTFFPVGSGLDDPVVDEADFVTIAYDAGVTAEGVPTEDGGVQLWQERYDGGSRFIDAPTSLGLSPDGSRLFAAGVSANAADPNDEDAVVVAYGTEGGAPAWVRRHAAFDGQGVTSSVAYALAVSPAGDRVFTAGLAFWSSNTAPQNVPYSYGFADAYDAATGSPLWSSQYLPGTFGNAHAIAAGPTRVYVAGSSGRGPWGNDCTTVVYEGATGVQAWAARYNSYPGMLSTDQGCWGAGVSPDGNKVFSMAWLLDRVNAIRQTGNQMDYAVLAYDA